MNRVEGCAHECRGNVCERKLSLKIEQEKKSFSTLQNYLLLYFCVVFALSPSFQGGLLDREPGISVDLARAGAAALEGRRLLVH